MYWLFYLIHASSLWAMFAVALLVYPLGGTLSALALYVVCLPFLMVGTYIPVQFCLLMLLIIPLEAVEYIRRRSIK